MELVILRKIVIVNRRRFIISCIVTFLCLQIILNICFRVYTADGHSNTPPFQIKTVSVQEGDSLWDIAFKHQNDMTKNTYKYIEEIKELNLLKDDTIKIGDKLLIPVYYDK